MKKKKVNENRVPIGKDAFDTDKILRDSTDGMVFQTWALVLAALADFSDTSARSLLFLWKEANAYHSKVHTFQETQWELDRLYKLTGVSFPLAPLRPDTIKTQGDLARFIRRANTNAASTTLAIIFEPIIQKTLISQERVCAVVQKIASLREELEEGRISLCDIQEMLKDEYSLLLTNDGSDAQLVPLDE